MLVVVNNANESNRTFDKTWMGISGNLDFVAHETRHLDGPFYHTNCCISVSCDSIYDETNLSCFGVQYWLNKSWLSGFINVGLRTSHTGSEIADIINWHLNTLNDQFRQRFCYNAPAVLTQWDFENLLGTQVVNQENSEFTIYPNPAENAISIKHQNGLVNAEIILTDINGRTIRKFENINVPPSADYSINISDLNTGSYLLILRLNYQTLNYKFTKD
jgi:hypothetical protein